MTLLNICAAPTAPTGNPIYDTFRGLALNGSLVVIIPLTNANGDPALHSMVHHPGVLCGLDLRNRAAIDPMESAAIAIGGAAACYDRAAHGGYRATWV